MLLVGNGYIEKSEAKTKNYDNGSSFDYYLVTIVGMGINEVVFSQKEFQSDLKKEKKLTFELKNGKCALLNAEDIK